MGHAVLNCFVEPLLLKVYRVLSFGGDNGIDALFNSLVTELIGE